MRLPPPSHVARMFLVRHGATAANVRIPFILQGCEINGSLNETGQHQARQLATFLQDFPIKAAYSSSLVRARETAEIVAQPHRLPVTPLHELREGSVGRWEGLDWETIRRDHQAEHNKFFEDPANNPHPGGESYRDVHNRVAPAILKLFQQHPGETILVVAHNLVNRVYLSELVGIPLRDARRLKQSNTGLNVLEYHQGKIELITMNSVLHLSESA